MKLNNQLCLLTVALTLTNAFPVVEVDKRFPKPATFKRHSIDSAIVGDLNSLPVKADDPSEKLESQVYPLTTKQEENTENTIESSESFGNSPFLMSISMIGISEIGDKTFLIAAIMAMRHSKLFVFSAAFSALFIMTVLSGAVGNVLPALMSQQVTQILAAILFIIFGIKLTKEGMSMSKDLGVEEELADVKEELSVNDINKTLYEIEGANKNINIQNQQLPKHKQVISKVKTMFSQVFSPLWLQIFVMTFLAEWGDRSQIATIAMAAGSNYLSVISGAVIAHGLCALAAVIGGQLLATRISLKAVTLGGASAFFVFSIMYFYEAFNSY